MRGTFKAWILIFLCNALNLWQNWHINKENKVLHKHDACSYFVGFVAICQDCSSNGGLCWITTYILKIKTSRLHELCQFEGYAGKLNSYDSLMSNYVLKYEKLQICHDAKVTKPEIFFRQVCHFLADLSKTFASLFYL